MLDKFDLIIINICKKLFYILPGDSILGIPVGKMISLVVLVFGLGELYIRLNPNAAIKTIKKVSKK